MRVVCAGEGGVGDGGVGGVVHARDAGHRALVILVRHVDVVLCNEPTFSLRFVNARILYKSLH